MNIASLPTEEQRAIQRDKATALWAHKVKTGQVSEGSVIYKINQIDDEARREDIRNRFNRYMNAISVNESE